MPQVNKFQSVVLSIIGGLFVFAGSVSIIWSLLSSFQEPVMVNHHLLALPFLGAAAMALGLAIARAE